jgi:hypothetical protein
VHAVRSNIPFRWRLAILTGIAAAACVYCLLGYAMAGSNSVAASTESRAHAARLATALYLAGAVLFAGVSLFSARRLTLLRRR